VLDKAGEGEIDPMRDTAFRYLRNGTGPAQSLIAEASARPLPRRR
jgi:hypothetical protein